MYYPEDLLWGERRGQQKLLIFGAVIQMIHSLLNLTAHWIGKSFTKVSAVLHAHALGMTYTGKYSRRNFLWCKVGIFHRTCSLIDQ